MQIAMPRRLCPRFNVEDCSSCHRRTWLFNNSSLTSLRITFQHNTMLWEIHNSLFCWFCFIYVRHICDCECAYVSEEHIVNFCGGSITGTSVSIMYDQVRKPVDSDTTCSCRTSGTGQGQTPLFIEALDVHLGNNSSAGCSSLMLNAHDRNSVYDCNSYVIHPSQILISVNGTLPITSQLTVAKNSPPHRVWMRIQGILIYPNPKFHICCYLHYLELVSKWRIFSLENMTQFMSRSYRH